MRSQQPRIPGALGIPHTRSGPAALAWRLRPLLIALFYNVGPFAALVAVWALVVALIHPSVAVLPSPLRVAEEVVYTLRSGVLPDYVQRSLARLLLTAAAVIPLGVTVGLLVGLVRPAATLMPVFR